MQSHRARCRLLRNGRFVRLSRGALRNLPAYRGTPARACGPRPSSGHAGCSIGDILQAPDTAIHRHPRGSPGNAPALASSLSIPVSSPAKWEPEESKSLFSVSRLLCFVHTTANSASKLRPVESKHARLVDLDGGLDRGTVLAGLGPMCIPKVITRRSLHDHIAGSE